MTKVVLNDLVPGYLDINALNENFGIIEEAFDNTVSRDGDSPNAWASDLDANSYTINNLPDAEEDTQPVPLGQLNGLLAALEDGVIYQRVETQTATAGQTIFDLNDWTYSPGINAIAVYRNGRRLISGVTKDYTEESTSRIVMNAGVDDGDEITFIKNDPVTTAPSEVLTLEKVNGYASFQTQLTAAYIKQGAAGVWDIKSNSDVSPLNIVDAVVDGSDNIVVNHAGNKVGVTAITPDANFVRFGVVPGIYTDAAGDAAVSLYAPCQFRLQLSYSGTDTLQNGSAFADARITNTIVSNEHRLTLPARNSAYDGFSITPITSATTSAQYIRVTEATTTSLKFYALRTITGVATYTGTPATWSVTIYSGGTAGDVTVGNSGPTITVTITNGCLNGTKSVFAYNNQYTPVAVEQATSNAFTLKLSDFAGSLVSNNGAILFRIEDCFATGDVNINWGLCKLQADTDLANCGTAYLGVSGIYRDN